MGRKFTYADVRNWKVCDRMGKPLRYTEGEKRGKPMTDLNGYLTANAAAVHLGGVAVRA